MTREKREQELRRIAACGNPGMIELAAIFQGHYGGSVAAPPDTRD